MKMKGGQFSLLLITVLVCIQLSSVSCECTTALETSERSSQKVVLKFYRIQMAEWNDKGHSSKIAVQVSTYANTYCVANPSVCGMAECCSGNTTFKDTNVGIASVEDDDKDMKLTIYLNLPAGANATGTLQCVVGMGALQAIAGNARDAIHTEVGSWITYVDDEFYGIPPASRLNRILIPVAFAILFLICLTAVILHYWNKRREELERKKKIIEKRKATSKKKSNPTYAMDTREPKVPHGVDGWNGAKEKPKRKDELYRVRHRQSTLSNKKDGSGVSSDSAIKMDTEPRHRQAQSLSKKLDKEPPKYEGATNYGYENEAEILPKKDTISEATRPPVSHLAPLNDDVDTEDGQRNEKDRKKKKKKKKSKSREVNEVSDIGNDLYMKKTSVWDFNL